MRRIFFFYMSSIKNSDEANEEIIMNVAQMLLNWYKGNKRDLPWRKNKDPYRIWVSEIMLQQTRVEVVKGYFERWIERFPTLESLAQAQEDEVIQYWQGLGYYSRARNLLRGVQEVSASYGGRVPDTKAEVASLAGIGDYTSGAILSIAYSQKEPAIDGNVLRVFSRLYCIDQDISSVTTKKQIRALVERELPVDKPGDFNQALMDLGATICIPKVPRCSICPLRCLCLAAQQGRQLELPIKKKKNPPIPIRVIAGVAQDGGTFLLRRRPEKGLLANMWEFPAIEIGSTDDEMTAFRQQFLSETGQEIELETLLFECTHTFSHRQWHISFYRCVIKKGPMPSGHTIHWINQHEWGQLSFAGPHRKMADFLLRHQK